MIFPVRARSFRRELEDLGKHGNSLIIIEAHFYFMVRTLGQPSTLLEIVNWNFVLCVTTTNTQRKWDIYAFHITILCRMVSLQELGLSLSFFLFFFSLHERDLRF